VPEEDETLVRYRLEETFAKGNLDTADEGRVPDYTMLNFVEGFT
jgi:hypothetical protein